MKIEGFHDGDFQSATVLVDGIRLDPGQSLKVRNHSPDGFSWGYSGSGPAQLALAILLRAGVPPEVARLHYQDFKQKFIAPLPQESRWEIDIDVEGWVALKEASS